VEAGNWKAVAAMHAVQLSAEDQGLLDKVQVRLALTDQEFLHFMILIGKVAPGAARLAGAHVR